MKRLRALACVALRHSSDKNRTDRGWRIALTFAILFLLLLAANELVGVITSGSMRYLMSLWPITALRNQKAIRCGQRLDQAGLVLELYAWTEEACTAAAQT